MPLSGLDLTKHDDVEMGDKEDGPQIYKFDANSRTLYLKQVPVFVSRSQLKDAVNSVCGGLEQVIFSEPLKMTRAQLYDLYQWLYQEIILKLSQKLPSSDLVKYLNYLILSQQP